MFSVSSYDVGLLNNKAKPTGVHGKLMNHFGRREEEWKLARVGKVLTRGGVRTRISGQASKKSEEKKSVLSVPHFFMHTFMLYSQRDGHFGRIVFVL